MKKQQTFYTGDNYTDDLRSRMLKAGISIGALARASEIDRSQLSRMFNRKMQPRLANVARLEQAFKELTKK